MLLRTSPRTEIIRIHVMAKYLIYKVAKPFKIKFKITFVSITPHSIAKANAMAVLPSELGWINTFFDIKLRFCLQSRLDQQLLSLGVCVNSQLLQ